MPIYEYHCRKCGFSFEKLRSMKDADDPVDCPKCKSTRVERQFSTFAAGGCGGSSSGGFV
jgi:putative FmdB family regulatory protein